MINDKKIHISVGASRKATYWPTQEMLWSEFVARLQTPVATAELLREYRSWPKARQDEIKDVGGFVGGRLLDGRRKPSNVQGRELVTLDADCIPAGKTQDVINAVDALGCAYVIYSTRKHEPAAPRLRIIIPLDRAATVEEYEPAARKLASMIGMEIMDATTFQAARLMYWPSISSDSQYVYTYADKPWINLDGLLAMYADWRDVSQWPQVPGAAKIQQRAAAKQGDPTAKHGPVGAFCRVYDVVSAINTYLPDDYSPCDTPNRYTYTHGSTVGGAIIYNDGQFLFSHHATDPCSGRLVNAFDLVRLHRFSELDDSTAPDTPANRLPSYRAMVDLALQDKAVASMLVADRYKEAVAEFDTVSPDNDNWRSRIKLSTSTGTPLKTIDNICIILDNDPQLKGKIAYDEHANRPVVLGGLPWPRGDSDRWTDTDDAGLRHYIERAYCITGKDRIMDAFALCAQSHRFHRIRDYLRSVRWDGIPRLDTLLIDYLGAEDSEYTRLIMRKSLVAAVARVMRPGTKYDTMLTMTGAQGIGKTTFLAKLGRDWHLECGADFRGKETAELIQGYWLIELGELKGFSRADTTDIKQFLSRREDVYREPYGRRTTSYPRQCVFFGTTNDREYLRDPTGNRRFWPVDLGLNQPTKDVFSGLDDEVDQIWAEAVVRYNAGEPLYLEGEAAKEALHQQQAHVEANPKEGIIHEFVARRVPRDWYERDIAARRAYWGMAVGADDTIPRPMICTMEIWYECFGRNLSDMRKADAMEISNMLAAIPGWERKARINFGGAYGRQRGFVRCDNGG